MIEYKKYSGLNFLQLVFHTDDKSGSRKLKLNRNIITKGWTKLTNLNILSKNEAVFSNTEGTNSGRLLATTKIPSITRSGTSGTANVVSKNSRLDDFSPRSLNEPGFERSNTRSKLK